MSTKEKVATFLERFVELLNESSFSETEIAKGLKVSKQTISAWKSGKRSPKEPTIIAISKYFHVDERWLMGFDVEKYGEYLPERSEVLNFSSPKTNEARILAAGIDRMPEKDREKALNMVRMMFDAYSDFFDDSNGSK